MLVCGVGVDMLLSFIGFGVVGVGVVLCCCRVIVMLVCCFVVWLSCRFALLFCCCGFVLCLLFSGFVVLLHCRCLGDFVVL